MASVTAFNDMLSQFLVELHKTFPEEKGIKKMTASFEMIKQTNPRLIVDGFMKVWLPTLIDFCEGWDFPSWGDWEDWLSQGSQHQELLDSYVR